MSRRVIGVAILTMAVGMGAAGLVWRGIARAADEPPGRARVVRGTVSARMSVAGTLLPRQRSVASFTTTGRVRSVFVQPRTRVTRGEALAVLESAQLASAVRRREFELERAKLRGAGGGRMADDEGAQARLAAIDVEVAAFELGLARAQLDEATLRAPVDGTVVHVSLQPGDMVGAGSGAAHVIIAEDDRYIVEVEGDESDIRRARPGARAVVTFGPPAAETLDGWVDGAPTIRRIGAAATGATTLMVTIALERNPADVQIGRAAHIEIEIETREDVPIAPLEALFRFRGSDHLLLHRARRWVAVPVVVGLMDAAAAELVEGAAPGAVVATGPSQRLREMASALAK